MEMMSPAEQMRALDIVQEGEPCYPRSRARSICPRRPRTRAASWPSSSAPWSESGRYITSPKAWAWPRRRSVSAGPRRSSDAGRGDRSRCSTLGSATSRPRPDEQYEGCLSFFDVRGMVPRPLAIEVEHQDIDGNDPDHGVRTWHGQARVPRGGPLVRDALPGPDEAGCRADPGIQVQGNGAALDVSGMTVARALCPRGSQRAGRPRGRLLVIP